MIDIPATEIVYMHFWRSGETVRDGFVISKTWRIANGEVESPDVVLTRAKSNASEHVLCSSQFWSHFGD